MRTAVELHIGTLGRVNTLFLFASFSDVHSTRFGCRLKPESIELSAQFVCVLENGGGYGWTKTTTHP